MRKLGAKGNSTPKEIERAYKASSQIYEKERLLAIKLAKTGNYPAEQIAHIISKGQRTIERWLQIYRAGGIQKLLERNYKGRKSSLSAQELDELRH